MKKIVALILSVALLVGMNLSAKATSLEEQTDSFVSENEAIELAKWFIANDIYVNNNQGWSEETEIESVSYVQGSIDSSYVIKLESKGVDNGYIVVGDDIADTLIKEYAYEGEPILILLTSIEENNNIAELACDNISEYSNNFYQQEDSLDFTEYNYEYLNVIRNHTNDSSVSTYSYGGITNPYEDVNEKYGSGWVESSDNDYIMGFTLLDMDNFTGPNHCSLTSMTAIFNYHRSNGYSNIPSSKITLFNRIKAIATARGYYNSSSGTYPWYIDDLATNIWQEYGYTGTGNNDFFYTTLTALNNKFKTEVNANRPGTVSFTTGTYGDHTVTFYGYKFYQKSGSNPKMYLRVNDNWSIGAKYVDTSYLAEHSTIFEICRVLP